MAVVSQARLLTTSWCHADPNHFPSRSMWSDTFTTIPSLCLPVAGVHNCFETSYADSATVDLCSLLRDLKSSSLWRLTVQYLRFDAMDRTNTVLLSHPFSCFVWLSTFLVLYIQYARDMICYWVHCTEYSIQCTHTFTFVHFYIIYDVKCILYVHFYIMYDVIVKCTHIVSTFCRVWTVYPSRKYFNGKIVFKVKINL